VLNASPMSHRRRNRTIGTLCLAVLSGLAFVVASGCSKSEAAPAPGKHEPAPVAASKADKDQYLVEMKGPSSCKAGSECKVEISLKAKGEFHINDKYPLKFKAPDSPPEGVTFTKAVVKKEDGKFAEKEGTLPVGFTIAKSGKAKISGTFSFSVCSDANCVMDKVDLDVEVEAK
jgi:hypothetical protein